MDMAANTNHNTGTAGEGTVAMNATDSHTLAYAARKGWGPAKTLAALGHPGYSAKFAAKVLATMTERNCSAWDAGVMGS
jgi:hypothetical protein